MHSLSVFVFVLKSFLKKCAKPDSKVVQYVYDCFGQKELSNCFSELDIADFDVHNLFSHAVSAAAYDKFVHSWC